MSFECVFSGLCDAEFSVPVLFYGFYDFHIIQAAACKKNYMSQSRSQSQNQKYDKTICTNEIHFENRPNKYIIWNAV